MCRSLGESPLRASRSGSRALDLLVAAATCAAVRSPTLAGADAAASAAPHRESAQGEDRDERLVDSPHLLMRKVPGKLTQAPRINRANLFDEHAGVHRARS